MGRPLRPQAGGGMAGQTAHRLISLMPRILLGARHPSAWTDMTRFLGRILRIGAKQPRFGPDFDESLSVCSDAEQREVQLPGSAPEPTR